MHQTRRAAAAAAFALAIVIAGCSKPPAPTAAAPPPSSAPVAEGAPRIVSSDDGVHIQYRLYGKGEPAIVLVHGWSCDSNYWRAQVAALKDRYTVLTVDLAGHGGSDRNRSDWSMAKFGQDVAAAVKLLPNPKVIIVGHSMGGPVAIEAARLVKDRTLGVIGVDTFKTIGAPPPPPDQMEARLKLFEQDFIGATRAFVSQSFFTKNADPQFVEKIALDMSSAPADVAIAAIRGLNAWDPVAAAAGFDIPVIAINSDLGMPTNDELIKKTLPTFRSVTLSGTGHFLMMESPDSFNSVLLEQIAVLTGDTAT